MTGVIRIFLAGFLVLSTFALQAQHFALSYAILEPATTPGEGRIIRQKNLVSSESHAVKPSVTQQGLLRILVKPVRVQLDSSGASGLVPWHSGNFWRLNAAIIPPADSSGGWQANGFPIYILKCVFQI
jgi:hypothetical protein